MKRYVIMLAWILWAHEMSMVGDKVVDRGYTAIDSFETRERCHEAMADYVSLKLVRLGRVKVEFSCAPEVPSTRPSKTVIG